MSQGGIGGNLSTSILFDVTGVRIGAETAKREFETLGGTVMRTSTVFKSSAEETNGAAQAIERAAEALELLGVKMLAIQAKATKTQQSLASLGQTALKESSAVNSGVDSFSVGQGKKKSAKQAAEDRANEARAESERIAAERRRRAEMIARRQYEDARRFSSGARLAPGMRHDAGNLSESFFNLGRDANAWARGRRAVEGMRDAIFQARSALDPMVAMEARIARESAEFERNMRRAVASQSLTNEQAREMLATYRLLTQQQIEQARNQQESFLGMRSFGFMAQQGAYAIEDFAQVFGTMGVAGGIRAAGNNLTAMAAVAGPLTGVFASLSAAVVMIGVHLWESAKALKDSAESEEKRLETVQKMVSAYEQQIQAERSLSQIRSGSLADLSKLVSDMQRDADMAHASAMGQRASVVEDRIRELEVLLANMDSGYQNAANAVMFAGPGAAPSREAIEAMRSFREMQEIQSRMNQDERARLNDEMWRQKFLLDQIESGEFDQIQRAKQREEILARVRDLMENEVQLFDTMSQLQADYVTTMNSRFETEERENERIKAVAEIAEKILSLQKEGESAANGIASAINARFAGLNEEFAIEQQVLETRKKINEQLELAQRAGVINANQAIDARQELQAVVMLEMQRREAQEAITEAEERQKEIRKQLVNPAGLTGAIRFGSQEAIQVLEQERLRKLAVDENKPVVEELRRLLNEIKAQKAILEKIAQERPAGAVLEGF